MSVKTAGGLTSKGGFTLIELIMTIVLLGLTSIILVPFFNAITKSPDPIIRQRAIALGQSLMDEILAKKWDRFSPTGGGEIRTLESPAGSRGLIVSDPSASAVLGRDPADGENANDRNNWDDVDDFNGHSNTNNFLDQNNNGFSLTGYGRSVQVDYIASSANPIDHNNPAPAGGATDTKRIIVTVTAPNGETFNLVAVVCNF